MRAMDPKSRSLPSFEYDKRSNLREFLTRVVGVSSSRVRNQLFQPRYVAEISSEFAIKGEIYAQHLCNRKRREKVTGIKHDMEGLRPIPISP